MKIKINQSLFLDAMIITGRVIRPDGGVLPILGNYLIDVLAEEILITGSNMETFITKPVVCETSQPGSFLIPSERLRGVVSYLPNQELTIELLEQVVKITANEGIYIIPYENSDLYPKLSMGASEKFRVNLSSLSDKVTFCCLQSATSPFFGVFIEPSENGLSMTGCNLAALSSVSLEIDKVFSESFLIRQSTLNALIDGPADVVLSDSNISFTFDDKTVIKAVLLDMKYPNWRQIVPENPHTAKIDRSRLVVALKRVTQFSEALTSGVKIELRNNNFTLLAHNNLSEKATETVSCIYTGPDLDVSVNGKYFIQVLEKVDGQTVDIKFKDDKTALVINQNGHIILLMPIKL
jgi:DNA polymerase-3 subunit beta